MKRERAEKNRREVKARIKGSRICIDRKERENIEASEPRWRMKNRRGGWGLGVITKSMA